MLFFILLSRVFFLELESILVFFFVSVSSAVPMSYFASGSGQAWGSTIKGLFLVNDGGKGVSLTMDDSLPLQISIDDPQHGNGICLLANK